MQTLHEMCRETLNPQIGKSAGCFCIESLYDVYFTQCCFGESLGDVMH